MNLFYQPDIDSGATFLDPEESRHCSKVLRKKRGDTIRVTDGKGFFYTASIQTNEPTRCEFNVLEKHAEKPRDYGVHIALSPTKNIDRVEWFVEKATELGIDRISLLECAHTERHFVRTDRLRKVAVSAMKQSLRATLPTLDGPLPYLSFLNSCEARQRFIAYIEQQPSEHLLTAASAATTGCVLIGPEGDFSADEITEALDRGFKKVTLGDQRLRTETAALAACLILNLINVKG